MSQPIYITQGEDAVSSKPDTVITTILGSCISICLWDAEAGVGGMNHLLLPGMKVESDPLNTTGSIAMERLLNQMVRLGAQRTRLRAKMFGGSSMLQGRTDIGERNAEFGEIYLKAENIPCDVINVGGSKARKLRYFPATGVAQMKLVEQAPELAPVVKVKANDVELF